jgi:hypothetical protein
MRLINVHTMQLEEYYGTNIPPYAILSHTWDLDEVSFHDFHSPTARDRAGFLKIEHACEQARNDNIGHVWVDTCAIDKTSSAELSEAINSMFHWYEKAVVCYAYLRDVPAETNLTDIDSAFAKSRWFTRGW